MASNILKCTLAATLLAAGGAAHSTVYTGVRTTTTGAAGAGTVTLTLTTDGTIGALGVGNLLDWTIVMADGLDTKTLDKGNSSFELGGAGALVASASAVTFDFDGPTGYVIFRFTGVPFGQNYYCLQTNSACLGMLQDGEAIDANLDPNNPFSYEARSGNVTIATAQAVTGVPEPLSWALMVIGLGSVGSAMRMGRRERPMLRHT